MNQPKEKKNQNTSGVAHIIPSQTKCTRISRSNMKPGPYLREPAATIHLANVKNNKPVPASPPFPAAKHIDQSRGPSRTPISRLHQFFTIPG